MTDSTRPAPDAVKDTAPVFDLRGLLGAGDRAFVRHDDTLYCLRLTQNNKLILTK
jgi:hemin uptake protein HemP